MRIREIPELNIINDIVHSYTRESRENYLEGKGKLDFTSDIGLSSVMDSPLIKLLRTQHPDIESSTSDHLDVMIGDFVHNEVQRKIREVKTNCYIEHPLPIKVKGELGDWTLSGRIDILEMISDKEVKIGDIKATSAYQVQTLRRELNTFKWSDDWRDLKHKYFYQLNAYAEGMRQQGHDVKELYLLVYCKHWTKRLSYEDNFPKYPFDYMEIPILKSEEIQEYLTECVNRHQAQDFGYSEHNVLPSCSKKDLWLDEHKEWAVMVKGKKRAVKLFQDKSEAESYAESIDKSFIEHRPMGLPMRCKEYCLYNQVCPQYSKLKQELGVKDE